MKLAMDAEQRIIHEIADQACCSQLADNVACWNKHDPGAHLMKPANYLTATVLLFSEAAYAADDVQAALLDIERASLTPQIVSEFCARQYPGTAGETRAAYQAWRRKHEDLIFEMESRADNLARLEAQGDEAKYADQDAKNKASVSQYRAAYEASLRRLPAPQSEAACAKYGADLTQGRVNVSDLETMFASQLKLIRQGDPRPGSGRTRP